MSSYLTAELVRVRQHEIAAAARHSEHRRELLAAKRAPRRSLRSLVPRLPRIAMPGPVAGPRSR
jgi:hypothetical protein